MRKHIVVFLILLFVLPVVVWADGFSEEIQALQSKEAAGYQLTPGEKSQLESYLTQRQRENPWLDTSWGTDGWYSAVDQNSGGQPFNWIEISTTGTEIWPSQNQDDTWSPAIDLPFTFPFYWMQRDSVKVSANVILCFNNQTTPSYSLAVPSNTGHMKIDPWCYDMYHLGADTVAFPSSYFYQAFGDSLFVVQFQGARYYNTTYRYDPTYAKDLEVLLYSDGRIVFQYDSLRNIVAASPYNSGIDDSVGTAGLTCGNSFSQGQAITFTPLTGVILASGQVNPISGNTSTNFVYQVKYRNTAMLAPTSAQVYIDDVAYALVDSTGGAGNYYMGVNFYHTTTLAQGAHNYYFQFEYGGSTYRYPETGYLAGPTVYAAMSGSYDIGGGANDFSTIVAAVTFLSGAGLSGPVVFNVYNGTYDGQVLLPYTIPGLSSTNTLTIQAAPGQYPVVVNSTGTTSTTGTCFHITGADYITIKGFEIRNCYGAGIYVYYGTTTADSAKNITIENNYIHDIGTGGNYYCVYSYYTKNLNLLNNKLQGDYYGLYLYYSTYATIANNMFWGQDYYGVYHYYGGYHNYYYNTIYMNSAYATTNYALYITTSGNNTLRNNIIVNAGSGSATKYAFYLSGTIATYPITSNYNDLYAPNGGSVGYYTAAQATLAAWRTATGLDLNSVSVNPNFISTVAPFNFHLNPDGSLVSGRGTPVSVTIDIDYETRDAVTPDIGADEVTFSAGGHLTMGQVTPSMGTTSTNFVYQVLWTHTGNTAPVAAQVYVDDVAYAMVDSTGGSGNYANGVNFYKTMTLPGGTHNYYFLFSDGARTDYRYPAVGYLTGPTVLPPFSGAYDIGGGANHYPTIVAAATSLASVGMAGPVTFNVYNGNYDGQVNLPYTIPGLSATNTLTIQAAPGQSPHVLNSTGTTLTTGCGFYITGADYITIKGFEIRNCYGAGVYVYYGSAIADSARYVTIENNYIHDVGTGGSYHGIYSYYTRFISILNNRIQGDYYGLYMYYNGYATVANNMIWGQDYYGVYNYYGSYATYYYNTIYMNSAYATTNYAVYQTTSSNNVYKDNIIINAGSGSTTKYAFYLSGTISTYPITSDYNDLQAPNGGSVGYYTAARATLAAWQTATGLDAHSISADPNFMSTVLPFNFHINNTAPSPVDAMATPVPVTVDYDYEARHAVTPDIGADEFAVPTYNVAVGPTPQSQTGNAGTDVAYYFYVQNTGNVPESFNLSTLEATWTTAIYDSAGTTTITTTPLLAVGANYWVKVTHSVPAGTIGGSTDSGQLKAIPDHNPAVFATGSFTTTAAIIAGVTVTPETQNLSGYPGTGVDYYYYIHNGSNLPDVFNLSTFGAAWPTAIYDSAGTTIITATSTIALGDSQCVKVVHSVPSTALSGEFDLGYLQAVSTLGSAAADTSTYTTTAQTVINVTLGPETQSGVANAGSSAGYYYFVHNLSNIADVFNLGTFGAAWPTAIYDSAGTTIITSTSAIPIGGTEWVKVVHSVPGSALVGEYDTGYLTATSTLARIPADTSSFTTTVPPNYGVEVTPVAQQSYTAPGSLAEYYCIVHNTGGVPDAYNLSTFGALWPTAIYDSSGTTIISSTDTLAIDESACVKVVHSVPGSAGLGDSDTGYLAAVSTHDSTFADTAAFTSQVPTALAVTVSPESQNLIGEIGADVAYYYYIRNGSSIQDAFSVATFAATWPTAIYDSSGTTIITATPTVAAGDSVCVKVVHSIPGSAQGGETDTGYLTATSEFYSAIADTAAFTSLAHQIGNVLLSPESQQQSVNAGTGAAYFYYVNNIGNGPDEFGLSTYGTAWNTAIYDSAGTTIINVTSTLAVGAGEWIKVVHNVPSMAQAGGASTGHLVAASTHYRAPSDTSSFTTTALNYGITLTPPSWHVYTYPGLNASYFFCIQNSGSFPDAYDLATAGAVWSTAIYDSSGTTLINSTGTLGAGEQQWVKVIHSLPGTALPGDEDAGFLTAVSQANPAFADSGAFTATTLTSVGVTITPPELADTVNTGQNAYYDFYLTNTGNASCDYGLWISGATWPVTIYDSTMSAVMDTLEDLAAGATYHLVVAHSVPLQPPDPLVDAGYIGVISLNSAGASDSSSFTTTATIWPPVRIVITPDSANITIPPGGGSFDYNAELANYGSQAYEIRLWNHVVMPNGLVLSLFGLNVNMNPTNVRSKDLTQYVPAGAPAGIYDYTYYIANFATWEVWDSSGFSFEKLAGDEAPRHDFGWALLGWEEELLEAHLLPTLYDLHSSFPNPFNPTTTLVYDLPENGDVLLAIYDVAGREVARLVDGYRLAGTHQATFSADGMSSGMYFAIFRANGFSKVQKMLLVK